MGIVLNKKKILVFAILLLLITTAIFLFFHYSEIFSKYKTYSTYGTISENKESKKITIKSFLKSIEEKDNEYCLQFVSMTENLEEFNICINKKLLIWENPYEDYSKLIPVNIVLNFNKIVFNISLLKEVKMTLLEDEGFMDFLYEMDEEQIRDFQVRIKSNEEVSSKGYYYQEIEGANLYLVTIINALIDEVNFDEGRVELSFNASIQGEEIWAEISAENLEYRNSGNGEESLTATITEENINLLKTGESCIISFTVNKEIEVDEYMLETFLNKERSAGVLFENIYVFSGGTNEN